MMRSAAGQTSNHHAALESLLYEKVGISGIGNRIAALIGLPPHLGYLVDGFQRISSLLRRERPLLSAYAPEVLTQFADVELSDLLMSVAQEQRKITAHFGPDALKEMARPSDRDRHPLSSYCISVAHVWAGLFYTAAPGLEAESGQFESAFSEFAVFLLGCNARAPVEQYVDFIRTWSESGRIPQEGSPLDPEIATRLETGSRAMRRLTLPQFKPLFEWLCPKTYDDSDLPRRVTSAFLKGRVWWIQVQRDHALEVDFSAQKLNGDELWTALLGIVGVLQTSPFWTTPGQPRKSTSSAGGGSTRRTAGQDGYVRLAGSNWIVDREVIDEGAVFESIHFAPENETDDPDCPKLGVEQDQPSIHSVTVTRGEPGTSTSTIGHPANRRSHIARQYLRPTCTFQQPTPKEIQQVLRVAMNPGFPNDTSTAEIKCRLVILAMLSTGRSLESMLSIEVIKDRKYIGQSPIQFLASEYLFVVRTEAPQLKTDPLEGLNHCSRAAAHPTAQFVVLPDHLGFGDVLSRMKAPSDTRLWFPIQGLQKNTVTKFLHQVTYDDRIQASWLPDHTASLLLESFLGDFAPVHMLTGRPLAHSASQLHYAKYSATNLQHAHAICMSKILGRSVTASDSHMATEAPARDEILGNPTHPKWQAVSDLVNALRDRLTGDSTEFDLKRYNNDYVTYCWLCLVLSTGYRPVIAPLVADLDLVKTGVIVYADKAYSPSHRRAQYLPTLCCHQIIHLIQHARYLAAQLPQYREVLLEHGPFIHLSHQDGGHKAAAFRPTHFLEATCEVFGLRLYSLRRFVRSELLSAGVTGEVVDAFMGHWRFGTEPFSGHTSNIPSRLQKLAGNEVSKILVDLGIVAIPSKIHGRRIKGAVT